MSTKTSRSGPHRSSAGKSGKQGKGAGKSRKPVAPVRMSKERNWGPIAMFVAVGVVAASIVGWAAWALVSQDVKPWIERAMAIDGVVNWYDEHEDLLSSQHVRGPVPYEINPPAGGPHNERWQQCSGGAIYDEQIATEHAVHSMEHGAVWITYQPDLPADQVDRLASRVRGTDFTLLSPFPGQEAPISVQAWGFQLQLDDAGDDRIDEFIRTLRHNTALHDGPCSGGIASTGTIPVG